MIEITKKNVEKIAKKTLKNKNYDVYNISNTIVNIVNKNIQAIEKMINTGHYNKYNILKDIIKIVCKDKDNNILVSKKKSKKIDEVLNKIKSGDIKLSKELSLKKLYRKHFRKNNATEEQKTQRQNKEQQKENSSILPKGINKQNAKLKQNTENNKETNQLKRGWLSLLLGSLSSLKARFGRNKNNVHEKQKKKS